MLVDKELGIDYCGREDVYKKFIGNFIDNYKSSLDNFEKFSNEDKKICIHSIKGLSLNLGSKKLYDISLKQEESLELNGDLIEGFIEMFREVYRELKIIYNELE